MSLDAETIKKAVKKLEWVQSDNGSDFIHCRAQTMIGIYEAWHDRIAIRDGIKDIIGWSRNSSRDFECSSLDNAKAFAQADYEARIISALSPEFLSALDTESSRAEAMRKALEPVAWRWKFDEDAPWSFGTEKPTGFRFGDPTITEPLFSSLNPGDADGFRPNVTHYPEGDFSQMLVEDGPTITDRPVLVEPLISMSDREKIVGFQWTGKTPPAPRDDLVAEVERLRAAVDEAYTSLKLTECPHPAPQEMAEDCEKAGNCGCCYGEAFRKIRAALEGR